MAEPRSSQSLPVGKLPASLLGRLIETYASTDPTVIVGPGIGGDAAAIAVGEATLVVKTDPITFATANASELASRTTRLFGSAASAACRFAFVSFASCRISPFSDRTHSWLCLDPRSTAT